jgi:enoyl-[acyl-carrier-protein] reductase (NADH)
MRRPVTVTDVANWARWLASAAASAITAKIVKIDAGAEAPTFPTTLPDLATNGRHRDAELSNRNA